MKRRILVQIATDGAVTVEADGFQGKGCEAATEAIEQALGVPVQRQHKRERWHQEQRNQQQLGGGGS